MAESKTKKKAAGAADIPEDDFSRKARAPQGKEKGASRKAKAGGTPSSVALRAPASSQGEAPPKAQ